MNCANIKNDKNIALNAKEIKYVLINYEEVVAKSAMDLRYALMAIINIIVFHVTASMCANIINYNINVLSARDDLPVNMVSEKQPVQIVMEAIFALMNSKRINVSNVIQKMPVSIANPSLLLVHDGNPIAFVATVCYILMPTSPENIN
jgi:hypothetical protein